MFVLRFVLKKRVVEEGWPQQHIEGIASRGGSQRRDTQSQGLQALHIHKIRESRNKSIQKPLRRRFLLTLIRLWSDNLTAFTSLLHLQNCLQTEGGILWWVRKLTGLLYVKRWLLLKNNSQRRKKRIHQDNLQCPSKISKLLMQTKNNEMWL
jgi:hypothetical protein